MLLIGNYFTLFMSLYTVMYYLFSETHLGTSPLECSYLPYFKYVDSDGLGPTDQILCKYTPNN